MAQPGAHDATRRVHSSPLALAAARQRAEQRIRRRVHEGTNLDIGAVPLAIIEDNPDTMPRKPHSWETAHTVYTALTCNRC